MERIEDLIVKHKSFLRQNIQILKFKCPTFVWVADKLRYPIGHSYKFNLKTNKFSSQDAKHFKHMYITAYWATILHSIDNMDTTIVVSSKKFRANCYAIWSTIFEQISVADYYSWETNTYWKTLKQLTNNSDLIWNKGWNAGVLRNKEGQRRYQTECGYLKISDNLLSILRNPHYEYHYLEPMARGDKNNEPTTESQRNLRNKQIYHYIEIEKECVNIQKLEYSVMEDILSEDFYTNIKKFETADNYLRYYFWKKSEHSKTGLVNNIEDIPKQFLGIIYPAIFLSYRMDNANIEKVYPKSFALREFTEKFGSHYEDAQEYIELLQKFKNEYALYKEAEWGLYHRDKTKQAQNNRMKRWNLTQPLTDYDEKYWHHGPADKIYAEFELGLSKYVKDRLFYNKDITFSHINLLLNEKLSELCNLEKPEGACIIINTNS